MSWDVLFNLRKAADVETWTGSGSFGSTLLPAGLTPAKTSWQQVQFTSLASIISMNFNRHVNISAQLDSMPYQKYSSSVSETFKNRNNMKHQAMAFSLVISGAVSLIAGSLLPQKLNWKVVAFHCVTN